MFNPEDYHQPDDKAEPESKFLETNLLKFYRSVGNKSEFGLYFSAGLSAALILRLANALVFYFIAAALILLWLFITRETNQVEKLLIAIALIASAVAGFWDLAFQAILAFIAIANSLTWFGLALGLVALVMAVVGNKRG